MLFQLARYQVTPGDLQLLGFRVAGQLDYLEPVPQRRMHRLKPVGGRQKQYAGQVERQIQVVIGEGVVLRRIKHFQQRRRRVAPEVRAHLVQLIEHDHRVAALDALQGLDDPPGQ